MQETETVETVDKFISGLRFKCLLDLMMLAKAVHLNW